MLEEKYAPHAIEKKWQQSGTAATFLRHLLDTH